MGWFNQGQRLGDYAYFMSDSDGRRVYKQVGGDNFLYWVRDSQVWMVGQDIGVDYGGILNRGSAQCPEGEGRGRVCQ